MKYNDRKNFRLIAVGHQPAADLTIFLSDLRFLVQWFDNSMVQSVTAALCSQRFKQELSCRAALSLRSNPPFCFVLVCAEIVVHGMLTVFLNGLNGKNSSRSIARNIFLVNFFILD